MSKKRKHNKFLAIIMDILFFIIAFVIIVSFVFASSQVNQSSMDDTLKEGDRLIEFKLTYFFTEPKRGEIVIFAQNPYKKSIPNIIYQSIKYLYESRINNFENRRLIKRVIGLPGEVIDIKEGFVYINGEKLDEPYVKGKTISGNNSIGFPITVPEGYYFVMGDNRQSSHDSRAKDIGMVSRKEQIEGKIILRIWPFEKFGEVD